MTPGALRPIFYAAVAVLLAGCSRGGRTTCLASNYLAVPSMPFFTQGAEYRGTVLLYRTTCDDSDDVAVQQSTLTDENGVEVSDARWSYLGVTPNGPEVELTFRPQTPGPYRYLVRLSPGLLVQGDLVAATTVERTELARFPVPDAWRCGRSALLTDGTFVCEHDGVLELVQNGVVIPGPTAQRPRWFAAGSALWVLADGELTRWLPRDGGMSPAQSAPVREFSFFFLAATETRAFGVLTSVAGGLDRVRWVQHDDGLISENLGAFDLGLPTELLGETSADGGGWWALTGSGGCLFSSEPDGGGACSGNNPGTQARFDATGLWWFDGRSLTHEGPDIERSSALCSRDYGFDALPLLRKNTGGQLTEHLLAVTTADAGVAYERLPQQYYGGWLEGDRLLMMLHDEVVVLRR